MTRRSQRHRSTSLPFRYEDDGVEFEIDYYSIDGAGRTPVDLKPGQTEIDLSEQLAEHDATHENGKSTALSGTLTIPKRTIDAVFPGDETEAPPAKLYVTIRCHETIYRDRKIVSEPPTKNGEYPFEIEIEKSDVRGTVELRPYLVRTTTRQSAEPYATEKNFKVASGKIFRLVVDRPEGEEEPAIDGEPINFSQVSHLPGGNKLYYLDFRTESRPKLWINSDHPRITEVLQSRGSVGAEARMRDVILDQMSYGVWLQLLVRAAAAIDNDGEVEHEWQDTILRTFARNVYRIDDHDEATRRLASDLADVEELPHLIQRIDGELQEYIDPRTQLINLMEEGLSI